MRTKGALLGVADDHKQILVDIDRTIAQQLTIVEEDSVQAVFHEAGRMPHRPKEYDHQLAPCNLAIQYEKWTWRVPWVPLDQNLYRIG